MAVHCAGCSTTAGIAGCPEHGSNTYTPPLIGVNDFITNCRHGVDLRFVPRCYLCRPDQPVEVRRPSRPSPTHAIGEPYRYTGKRTQPAPDVLRTVLREDRDRIKAEYQRVVALLDDAAAERDRLRAAAQAVVEAHDGWVVKNNRQRESIAALRAAIEDVDR